jgi:hypothetical protein
MAFRSSASFGKRQEYIAVAELLRRDFDVYMTLVDDQQIDCVIRIEDAGKPLRYLDVQIKARSKTAGQASTFAAMEIRHPRPNFWFIFYSEICQTYWVVPSLRSSRTPFTCSACRRSRCAELSRGRLDSMPCAARSVTVFTWRRSSAPLSQALPRSETCSP